MRQRGFKHIHNTRTHRAHTLLTRTHFRARTRTHTHTHAHTHAHTSDSWSAVITKEPEHRHVCEYVSVSSSSELSMSSALKRDIERETNNEEEIVLVCVRVCVCSCVCVCVLSACVFHTREIPRSTSIIVALWRSSTNFPAAQLVFTLGSVKTRVCVRACVQMRANLHRSEHVRRNL